MFALRSAVRRVATTGRTFATQAAKQATGNTGRRAAVAGVMTAAGFALATTYKSTTQPIEAAAAAQKAPIAGVKGTPSERSFIASSPMVFNVVLWVK
ncbi:hypothetical protein BCR44DRAFT_1497031 [Catenaria anguillulae PL171]|uniref:Uncharacterized protein n=1 Tax=Catenaria anguillulae PL171 TaxID=765915 RepID=A0A1Y2HZ16_9FUNG|nr:hypothetical protein BCR44DRAFT_1497031 [Catenaria anguillulae PL171]